MEKFDNLDVLPLHSHPEYLEDCCSLLSDEWPRSVAARSHMLEASSDSFPTSLLLIEKSLENGRTGKVIGHSCIGLVLEKPDSFWIKSVVISRDRRGQGLGKLLMLQTEQYAASKGLKCSYLTTHDKEGFYQNLGYDFCDPVCFSNLSLQKVALFQRMWGQPPSSVSLNAIAQETNPSIKLKKLRQPPPPPPPPPSSPLIIKDDENEKKKWMKKQIG